MQSLTIQCRYCGEPDSNLHHIFPSGLQVCAEIDIFANYRKCLRESPNVKEFVDYWKYLSPDIDNTYDDMVVKTIFDKSLLYFTDNFIIPGNNGDVAKLKYVNLIYPRTQIVLSVAQRGEWTKDKEMKTKNVDGSGYTFFLLIKHGFASIDDAGFFRIIE